MHKIIHGDCLQIMKAMEENSISCIVTDPPYGLHFMGKDWDQFKNERSPLDSGKFSKSAAGDAGRYNDKRNDEFEEFIFTWGIEALRIMKPGGHLLMFGSPRRFHRQTAGLEDAGFEIRDCLMWLYGSGFPKSHNHFGLEGYGTALKPAWEPVVMAMKPCEGTFKKNAEKWGQSGVNIDDCRIGPPISQQLGGWHHEHLQNDDGWKGSIQNEKTPKGRWPSNVLLDEEASALLDEQSGGASRFFYCAKASRNERNIGLEDFPCSRTTDGCIRSNPHTARQYQANSALRKNIHPTVKPLKLVEYLIKLVMPPKEGVLLDPFAGSGSTLLAAKKLGVKCIGIEKVEEYCDIARARLASVDSVD